MGNILFRAMLVPANTWAAHFDWIPGFLGGLKPGAYRIEAMFPDGRKMIWQGWRLTPSVVADVFFVGLGQH